MAHSLKYQIAESASTLEIEVGKLLDLASMLEAAGSESLAVDVSIQAHKLLQVAIALRIAKAECRTDVTGPAELTLMR